MKCFHVRESFSINIRVPRRLKSSNFGSKSNLGDRGYKWKTNVNENDGEE